MRLGASRSVLAIVIACVGGGAGSAAQGTSLRELVRKHGDTTILLDACGALTGLREIISYTQITIEGTITVAQSKLTPAEDNIYTEYVIEVSRVFRWPSQIATRSTPGPTAFSPFITGVAPSPGKTPLRVRLRRLYHGRLILEGAVVRAQSGFPNLTVGQHIIVSAFLDVADQAWVPMGVFEVRDGRVLHLDPRLNTQDYDSVEDFAAAVANPPPTVLR